MLELEQVSNGERKESVLTGRENRPWCAHGGRKGLLYLEENGISEGWEKPSTTDILAEPQQLICSLQ